MTLTSTKDHWAFLEEIESPMWVDLTVEINSNYEDIDDAWFHTSHMFHQCSSSQLKALFAHSGEGSSSSGFALMGPSSPKLPYSVSRSRGKHYRSSKWRENCDLLLNKQHPVKVLNRKSTRVNLGCDEEMKSKLSLVNSKGTSRSKISLVSENGLTGHANEINLENISSYGGLEDSPTSMTDKASQSNESTVTSESDQQPHQRIVEVSSRAFGTNELLSAMRISLRKSCVTRQASRVDGRRSRDRKSSSSKSSVGSSSNPGYLVRCSTTTLIQNKEQTPDSRNVARMTEAARNKVKDYNVLKASNVRVKGRIYNSRKGIGSNIAEATLQVSGKLKVQNQTVRAKALLPCRVDNQCLVTGAAKAKEKVKVGGANRLMGVGKENTAGRITYKCSRRGIATGAISRDQKGAKQIVPQKGDTTGLVGYKGKIRSPNKVKYPTNVTEKVHLQ